MLAIPSRSCMVCMALLAAAPVAAQAGGKFGAREAGRAGLRKGGRPTAEAIVKALEWLKAHQNENGSWGARGFQRLCPEGKVCDGAGDDSADLPATALALLAFLGDGSTLTAGSYSDNVQRGVAWLRVWNRAAAQRAVKQLLADQDARGGWCLRPGESEPDPMTTALAVQALVSARDFRWEVPPASLEKASVWLRQLPRPSPDPVQASATLLARIFLGALPQAEPDLWDRADEIRRRLPDAAAGLGQDPLAWYFGSYATFQMGGAYWNAWRQRLEVALLRSQQQGLHTGGSWDPPAGDAGGRVASTAIATLSLEVYYRYTKIVR